MNTLKAISQTGNELRVGNYIVLFGGKDLTGEFFTKKTHFDSNYTDLGVLYVDFEHGLDAEGAGNSKDNVLGIVDWKSARMDDAGIFVERVLNRRAKYVEFLQELIAGGILGTSSEAIAGLTRKKTSGEIVEWPLMRDSLTVTPMEPRMISGNVLNAVKALAEIFPSSKSLAMLTGAPTALVRHGPANIREFERVLHEKCGLSAREAKRAASIAWPTLSHRDDSDELDDIAALLSSAAADFQPHR